MEDRQPTKAEELRDRVLSMLTRPAAATRTIDIIETFRDCLDETRKATAGEIFVLTMMTLGTDAAKLLHKIEQKYLKD